MKQITRIIAFTALFSIVYQSCTPKYNKTDTSKDYLMIVNKNNSLNYFYKADDLVKIPNKYNNGMMNQMRREAVSAFCLMCNDAKKDGVIITSESAWRPYFIQWKVYKRLRKKYGVEKTNKICAKPGQSEHQTGLSLDINICNNIYSDKNNFSWAIKNAHKYGFILRYPKGKEKMTGFNYEPWHYRYVGKKAAKYIYDNNITFEEYYELYIKTKK